MLQENSGVRGHARVVRFGGMLLVVAALLWPRPGLARLGAAPGAEADEEKQARPKIGLVLSGGGARGLAHVGVLRWLEEHRVPVDFVAGTSMGGLVGGLYATGADSEELQTLLGEIDWPEILRSEAPYEQKAFRRKEDARDAPATFELGLRGGFRLPPGLNPGHHVGLVLDRVAFPYSGMGSFDELPTPFACVAVDLTDGEQVVYREGPLAKALRATMSYPGWFTPVVSGDQVLIDGGLLNNLPTDVMQQMGADVVIAVDLGMRASQAESIDSVLGVLNRSLAVIMRVNSDRNAELADLLITPDVSAFGFADFERADELTRIGYQATEELADSLDALRVDEATWDAYVAARLAKRRPFQAVPDFVEVEGAVPVDAEAVKAALDHHIGEPLDPDHLDDDLTKVAGWGRYDVVGYQEQGQGEAVGLGIDMNAKSYGPPFMRPILNLQGSQFGEAFISFGARFTFFDIANVNSEWRADLTYGQTTRAASELFVPLGNTGFFVAPRAEIGETAQFLYEEGEAVAEYEIETGGAGVDIGYIFGARGEVRLGFDAGYQRAGVKVGDPLLQRVEGAVGAVRARWSFDGANSPLLPTSGVRLGAEASWVFESPDATGDFYQARFDFLGARRLPGRFSLIGAVRGGTTFGGTAPPLRQFLLGGPLRLGALGVAELRGSNFFLGQAGLLWALADENRLSFFGKFYLTAFYEVGDAFEDTAEPFHDVTFGLSGETILGAVFVGSAVGQERKGGFFFAVGRLF